MAECRSTYFVKNGILIPAAKFNDQWIYKAKCIYEVFRIIDGVPLFWDNHYDRLIRSAVLANMKVHFQKDAIDSMIKILLQEVHLKDGNIKLVYSEHDQQANLLLYFVAHKYPDVKDYNNGVKTSTLQATRHNPNAKILNQQLRDKTNKIIADSDVYEVLLVDENEEITEGSRSNIFMIDGDNIYTPPVKDVLPGITRQYVINLCDERGLKVSEMKLPLDKISRIDGIFITGTSPGILPLVQVDNFIFNYESILLRRLMEDYEKLINNFMKENKSWWT
jgi:branched-chain amino acid aminotransferase